MFPRANNVVITGGYFTDYSVNNHDSLLTVLLPHVAAGAIFDSAERYPPGRCHPGTRQMVINRITNWIDDPNPVQRILWLYGPAGAGKSALMQAICEFLKDSDPGMNGGSFFFARGNVDRGKGSKLFVTLSYQLAIQFPSVREEITHALDRDPTLPTKSFDIQLRSLIINPLLRCQELRSRIPTLFIDGLDECDNDQGVDTQCEIITLISKSIVEHKIPIRFIIASRPEYWIREAFGASPVSTITFPLTLRDDTNADKDIRLYLTDNFEKIRREKSSIMQSVALPWPPIHIVDQFVHDGSGQYVYASTILKFVGDHSPFIDPREQLRIITTPGRHRVVAFGELDRLYSTILSVYPRWETMRRVLGGLLVNVNLTVIQVVLGVPKAEITLVLQALSSLIDISPRPSSGLEAYQRISFCHLSFREFLLDEMRSGLYHVDVDAIFTEVINVSIGMIQRNLEQKYKREPCLSYDISLPEYEEMMKNIQHLANFNYHEFRGLIPVYKAVLKAFRLYNPGIQMNHPQRFTQDMDSLYLLLGKVYTSGVKQNTFPTFLQLTKRLENLADVARDLHNFHVVNGMVGQDILWVVSAWWGMEYLRVQVYIMGMSVWDGAWYKQSDVYMLALTLWAWRLWMLTLACDFILFLTRD